MNNEQHAVGADDAPRLGPAADRAGVSVRTLRYLETAGIVRAERGPGPRGHRHFPPPELDLARAAADAMDAGHATTTLRTLRDAADRRVADARADADPLAWYELLALARAVELERRPPDGRPLEGPHSDPLVPPRP